ncbi:uncharacterized protein LOC135388128 [Ornithodoros turicata]|uniref:uncharacterized protein LOC135388128 n=1 Tax=Ornithodoros turicata TaxID=34597 RepID=UPI0031387757
MLRACIGTLSLLLLWSCRGDAASYALKLQDPQPVIYSGQANIALLAPLRRPPTNGTDARCGPVDPVQVRRAMAAVWAAQRANFRKASTDFNIGVYIYDTCRQQDVALRQTFRVVQQTGHIKSLACPNTRIPPVFGAVLYGSDPVLLTSSRTLASFSVPTMLASDSDDHLASLPNVYSTAPSTLSMSRGLVSVLRRLGWLQIVVVASYGHRRASLQFSKVAGDSGIKANTIGELLESFSFDTLQEFLRPAQVKVSASAAVLFLSTEDAVDFLSTYGSDANSSWIVVTTSELTSSLHDFLSEEKLRGLKNLILLSPSEVRIPEFEAYFQEVLRKTSVSSNAPFLEELRKTYSNHTAGGKNDIPDGWDADDGQVGAVVNAVSTLISALQSVRKIHCGRGTDCLFGGRLSNAILESFKTHRMSEGLHFTEDRHLATVKYSIKAVSTSGEVLEIGWYTDEGGLVVDEVLFPTKTQRDSSSQLKPFSRQRSSNLRSSNLEIVKPDEPQTLVEGEVSEKPPMPLTSPPSTTSIVRTTKPRIALWISKPWSLVIVVTSGFGILLSLYVMVFLLMKLCEGVVKKGHQVTSLLLLFSINCLFIASLLFTFKPSQKLCGAQQFAHHTSYVFAFGCLLLKGMHLNSMRSVGLGGRVNSVNQILTVGFIVGVQVAIEVQSWILKPVITSGYANYCHIQQLRFLFHEVYAFLVLLLAIFMAFHNRDSTYNRRDARSLLWTTLLVVPIAAAGNTAFMLMANHEYQFMSVAFTLVTTAYFLLVGIFGPYLLALHSHGGYQHKPLAYSDSMSSAFSTFRKELENPQCCYGRNGIKLLEPVRMPNGVVKNPLYLPGSAYP